MTRVKKVQTERFTLPLFGLCCCCCFSRYIEQGRGLKTGGTRRKNPVFFFFLSLCFLKSSPLERLPLLFSDLSISLGPGRCAGGAFLAQLVVQVSREAPLSPSLFAPPSPPPGPGALSSVCGGVSPAPPVLSLSWSIKRRRTHAGCLKSPPTLPSGW